MTGLAGNPRAAGGGVLTGRPALAGRPRAAGAAYLSPIFARDTFTEAADIPLASHTADDGGTWTRHPSATVAANVIAATGRVFGGGSGTFSLAYHSGSPGSADYDVSADIIMLSDNNAASAGVCGRMDTSDTTFYFFGYLTSTNAWVVFKFNAGTGTQLGSNVVQALNVGQAYRATFSLRGSTLKGYVDGVEIISQTDASITAAGKAGLRFNQPSSSAGGLNMDNLTATRA